MKLILKEGKIVDGFLSSPTAADIVAILPHFGDLRGVAVEGKVYLGKAKDYTHWGIRNALGVPTNNDATPDNFNFYIWSGDSGPKNEWADVWETEPDYRVKTFNIATEMGRNVQNRSFERLVRNAITESNDSEWITVYHGHQDAVSREHNNKFFSTDLEFAKEYGHVTVYQIRLGTVLDTTDQEIAEHVIIPLKITDPFGDDIVTMDYWYDFQSDTWEFVEHNLGDIISYYQSITDRQVDTVAVSEGGALNYIVLNKDNMRKAPDQPYLEEATAYHGSVRDFDKFDGAYVGTGDGALTFGWGIYLATDPSIAKLFKTKNGEARMFEVEAPDEEYLLDWNEKYDNQPAAVKAALEKMNIRRIIEELVRKEYITPVELHEMEGEEIYSIIWNAIPYKTGDFSRSNYVNSKRRASAWLLHYGIQGIKYQDVIHGQSSNYVIFNPSSIEVLKKS